jgi:hypothetical protein
MQSQARQHQGECELVDEHCLGVRYNAQEKPLWYNTIETLIVPDGARGVFGAEPAAIIESDGPLHVRKICVQNEHYARPRRALDGQDRPRRANKRGRIACELDAGHDPCNARVKIVVCDINYEDWLVGVCFVRERIPKNACGGQARLHADKSDVERDKHALRRLIRRPLELTQRGRGVARRSVQCNVCRVSCVAGAALLAEQTGNVVGKSGKAHSAKRGHVPVASGAARVVVGYKRTVPSEHGGFVVEWESPVKRDAKEAISGAAGR